ncbi:MAG TPA: NAD(P)H-dependent oxidoreductase subunit E, partial [Spirochaetia bacterium]|nr:NAD(P)H-dependent oxidoreductase subunit E [Spirochaetia bacterium]
VGACGLAPVVIVNDKVYGNVTTKQVGDIMALYINEEATHADKK